MEGLVKGYMSVKEAAAALGVTRGRVNQMIDAGILKADKVGAYWVVDERSVRDRLENHPGPGRPKG